MIKIQFAPLQGYTDAAFRFWHNKLIGGVDCYYSPFIRIEKSDIRTKDIKDILPENNEGVNLVPQIIVNGSDELNFLTDKIKSLGYSRIDVNLGCPFILQTRKCRGAALLPDPEKVKEIMNAISSNDDIKYSLKMRLGMNNPDDFLNLIDIINECRLEHVTLHPRIAAQQYRGNVDMNRFATMVREIKHPLIYNGDISDIDDINRIVELFPSLYAIMIGRGLLSNPCLAYEYSHNVSMGRTEKLSKIFDLHQSLLTHYQNILQGESQLLIKMKCFWEYLEPQIGRKSAKLIKKAVNMSKYNVAVASINCDD